jgi:hypothetical protein
MERQPGAVVALKLPAGRLSQAFSWFWHNSCEERSVAVNRNNEQ